MQIRNTYSKWPPLARTQYLSLNGRCLPKNRFKLSILGCLFLRHPLPWTELELPAGLSPITQGTDNQAVAGDKCSGLHLHFRLVFCKSRPKPLGLKIVAQALGDGLQVETSQYLKFKRSLWKTGADFPVDVLRNSIDEWPQRLKDCVSANGGHFE